MPVPDFEKRVAQYVQLRALIKAEDDAHKEKMEEKREVLNQLNNLMLEHLNTIGADSVRTKAGTVYRTAKRSASAADFAAFWNFVVKNKFWDLVDRKPNVTAVSEYLDEHKTLPPGVNLNSTYVVGVRKS
jgi:hypothetical protein